MISRLLHPLPPLFPPPSLSLWWRRRPPDTSDRLLYLSGLDPHTIMPPPPPAGQPPPKAWGAAAATPAGGGGKPMRKTAWTRTASKRAGVHRLAGRRGSWLRCPKGTTVNSVRLLSPSLPLLVQVRNLTGISKCPGSGVERGVIKNSQEVQKYRKRSPITLFTGIGQAFAACF